MVTFIVYPYPTKLLLFALGRYCYVLSLIGDSVKAVNTTNAILEDYNANNHVFRVPEAVEEFVSQLYFTSIYVSIC
jgi:hypothetical protein